jgi:3-oxoacyl-[acyl-carrier-protein] synthase II
LKRVVITGMGGITPLGGTWDEIERKLRGNVSGIRYMTDWDRYADLKTRLGAPVELTLPPHYTRKRTRAMGRVAQLGTLAAERALADAGLLEDASIRDGRMGVAFGSATGSSAAAVEFAHMLINADMSHVNATTYLRMMAHTAAVNIGVHFGLQGRVMPTTSACTSGSQAIGTAFESIRFGKQLQMIAGGAEELCPTEAAVFDTLGATSTRNDAPGTSPRPFDLDRDGLVIGEGAAALILEERESALARGARIYGEILGYGCNSDGAHVTQPAAATMARAMQLALDDAGLPANAIGYISAHATATDSGDIAEATATHAVFGERAPVSSMKGHVGHTLGACGAIETWWTLMMMRGGWFAPTLHLTHIDPRCAMLDHVTGDGRTLQCELAVNNNFAFGGINTSLVLRRA